MHFHKETWERKTFLLADQGISLRCCDEKEAALYVCQSAAELARKYLQGNPMYHWVMGGYAESLVQCERYEEAIHVALPSCEWERGSDDFGCRLLMAKSLLALNRAKEAVPYLLELYEKSSDKFLCLFPAHYHPLIRELILEQGKDR